MRNEVIYSQLAHDVKHFQNRLRPDFPQFIEKLPEILPDPNKIAALPTWQIDYIVGMPAFEINKHVFGFESGHHLRKLYSDINPDKDTEKAKLLIPSEQYMTEIKFRGEDSIKGLENRLRNRITQLAYDYPYAGKGKKYHEEYSSQGQVFDVDSIFQTMKVIKEHVRGSKRETGEETWAHLLRVTDTIITLIYHHNKIHRSGVPCLYYTPATAPLAINLALLHDFFDRVPYQMDKSWSKKGEVRAEGNDVLLDIRMVPSKPEKSQDENQKYVDPWLSGVIHMPGELGKNMAEVFVHLVKSINHDQDSSQTYIADQLRSINDVEKLLGSNKQKLRILKYLAISTKIADRNDNLNPYDVIKDKITGEYVMKPLDKSIRKAKENEEFRRLEEEFIEIAAMGAPQFGLEFLLDLPINNLPVISRMRSEFEIQNNKFISLLRHMLPSRWSRLKLLGVPPEAMWQQKVRTDDGYLGQRLMI